MKILPINSISHGYYAQKVKRHNIVSNPTTETPAINFYGYNTPKFEYGYTLEELKERTSPERFTEWAFLSPDHKDFVNLANGDKESIPHLIKATEYFNNVYKRLDNIHNLEFEKFLALEIANGSQQAKLTKKLYDAQIGILGYTNQRKPVALAKNIQETAGKGFYPEDLSEEEFHNILIKMLKEGKTEEVRTILNQRSVVFRNGNELKAIPYTEFFKEDFTKAADELELAAKTSTNKDFNEYLLLQAKALREENPELDCLADTKWVTLQDTPLEFTISRECYTDRMTPTVVKNPVLKELLEKHDIPAYAKDNFGVRVGIVDKEGTAYLLRIKEFLPFMAKNMPYSPLYEQKIGAGNVKQTMVDIHNVYASGDYAAYSGKITIASNLPNGDKLAVQRGSGFRNVYHKQIREAKFGNYFNAIKEVTTQSQHQYYNPSAMHDFTILHENIHSLGPKEGLEGLGVYKNTIEELKADMGALVMLNKLSEIGFYSPERVKELTFSLFAAYLPKGPDFNDAHRTRNIMQHNYFIQNGAIDFDDEGKMVIDFEKSAVCAENMLKNVIKIQLTRSAQTAEEYIKKWAVWTPQLDKLANKMNVADKCWNSFVTFPIAKTLLKRI